MKTGTFNWPEWVPIPHRVGIGFVYHKNGSPCCAAGHAHAAGIEPGPLNNRVFRDAYNSVAKEFFGVECLDRDVEEINDQDCGSGSERRLLYLASLAYLGYTDGMPKRAVRLAEKAKKRASGQ